MAIIGAALWYLFRRSGFSVGVKFGSPFVSAFCMYLYLYVHVHDYYVPVGLHEKGQGHCYS